MIEQKIFFVSLLCGFECVKCLGKGAHKKTALGDAESTEKTSEFLT
jgi:hypothetical protein